MSGRWAVNLLAILLAVVCVAGAAAQSSSCGLDAAAGVQLTGRVIEGFRPLKNYGWRPDNSTWSDFQQGTQFIPDSKQGQVVTKYAECNCICATIPICWAYTWLGDSGECWMHSYLEFYAPTASVYTDALNINVTVNPNTVVARVVKQASQWPVCNWYRYTHANPPNVGVTFPGYSSAGITKNNDSSVTNVGQCIQACDKDPKCIAMIITGSQKNDTAPFLCTLVSEVQGPPQVTNATQTITLPGQICQDYIRAAIGTPPPPGPAASPPPPAISSPTPVAAPPPVQPPPTQFPPPALPYPTPAGNDNGQGGKGGGGGGGGSSSSSNTGLIAGIIAAAVVVVLALLVGVFVWHRKQKNGKATGGFSGGNMEKGMQPEQFVGAAYAGAGYGAGPGYPPQSPGPFAAAAMKSPEGPHAGASPYGLGMVPTNTSGSAGNTQPTGPANTGGAGNTGGPTGTQGYTQGANTYNSWTGPTSGQTVTQTVESIKIPWSAISIGGVIGEGGQGKVYKGLWQNNRVAVKMLNVGHRDPEVLQALYKEALIMKELGHPCIARVYGLVDEPPHHALVMQYYRKGNLSAFMKKPAYAEVDMTARVRMALEVASGMDFLHNRNPPILHQDLKCSNLLIEENGQLVIADFGIAGVLDAGTGGVLASALTITNSPPEVLSDPRAPRTAAADVYAFAIVLLDIVTGQPSYRGMKGNEIKLLVCEGRRPPIPETVPPELAAIVKDCWVQDPAARPRFSDITQRLLAVVQDLDPHNTVTDYTAMYTRYN